MLFFFKFIFSRNTRYGPTLASLGLGEQRSRNGAFNLRSVPDHDCTNYFQAREGELDLTGIDNFSFIIFKL